MSIHKVSNKHSSSSTTKARAKSKRKVKSRYYVTAREREAFYILAKLLQLCGARMCYQDNFSPDQQIKVEIDFTNTLLQFLDFNNRHNPHSLQLGLRELDPDELDREEEGRLQQ
jgi:hypothetical protein